MSDIKKNLAPMVAAIVFVLFFIVAILYTLYPDMFGETLEGWYKHFK